MNKGIVFSTDAVVALIVVMSLAAWLPHQLSAAEEQGNAFDNLQQQSLDRAIMGFYKGLAGEEPDFKSSDFIKCTKVYSIGPNNNLGTRDLQSKQFCRAV